MRCRRRLLRQRPVLLGPLGTAANLATDAHIAALALEHHPRRCTADHDFRRFPGVEVIDPFE